MTNACIDIKQTTKSDFVIKQWVFEKQLKTIYFKLAQMTTHMLQLSNDGREECIPKKRIETGARTDVKS